MVRNYQNADCSFKEYIYCVIYYNFRHTFVPYAVALAVGGFRPYLICGSLGPSKSAANGISVGSAVFYRACDRDQHTDHATPSVTVVHNYFVHAMRANKHTAVAFSTSHHDSSYPTEG